MFRYLAVFVLLVLTSQIHAKQVSNKEMTMQKQQIVLGSGCFWGAEKRYQNLPGVIDAVSGYADGRGFSASYANITKSKNKFNPDNYAEVVEVSFDPNRISLARILEVFYENHNPTSLNRQGNDVGTQYRSTILYNSEQQREIALAVTEQYQTLLSQAGFGEIKTAIKPLDKFVAAETYHQDYLFKNPNGYCPDLRTGVYFSQPENIKMADNTALLQGKHLIVIESKGYCPYCEKFKKETANNYQGDIPMHFRTSDQLQGLTINSETWATPTFIFLEQGKEVFARQGYLSRTEFYQLLGAFKLGKSEAFSVAFNKGTDNRFCKQYEIFKNTPDGVFIDKLSGAPLFDTRDRFNSGTGWLSFTKPVSGAVYERPDHSFGMERIEIRAKESDIHLGHVFDDGPNGSRRYCINATVLDFVAR